MVARLGRSGGMRAHAYEAFQNYACFGRNTKLRFEIYAFLFYAPFETISSVKFCFSFVVDCFTSIAARGTGETEEEGQLPSRGIR